MTTLHGVYAITDEKLITESCFIQTVEQALSGGVHIIQYRDKSADHNRRLAQATALKHLCQQHDALLIINDDIELTLQADADGVHIGIDDMPLTQARARLGPNKMIGVSCYNRFELAQQAVDLGADYIAFGSFFPSQIKPHAPRATMELLIKAKQHFDVPVCAIGGITASNASDLITAGADMIAVISEIFAQPDKQSASQQLSRLFSATDRPS
ncbi:MAG: thiamine phosphate synthase [Gammaproteobacteria bacterium]|nr:MAG: thiamine phosphate synthase [Gammaproteobacteria bacterium]